ncbi:MAG: glycine cleavage T C-terminal barrel domain-containing protein [Thermoanaerobaculia bacterium]
MPTDSCLEDGLRALRSRAVVVDLTGRGSLAVAGPDAAELLHGLVTNDVKALRPGAGCHAALLTPKGKMRAELAVLRTDAELLLDCEPSLAAPLVAILSGYVPFSRSALEDRTSATGVVHVEGPGAVQILAAAGLAEPSPEPYAHRASAVDGAPLRVVRVSRAGESGFALLASRGDTARVAGLLARLGASPVGPAVLEAGRIEAGIPRWGAELDESVLPNEAWLERTAISYAKGCYLGQETVARLKAYGHVNRHLVALLLPPGCPAGPGDAVRAGAEKVGAVTSAADSPLHGRRVALAFVRREHESPGTLLAVETPSGDVEAVVAAVPLGR